MIPSGAEVNIIPVMQGEEQIKVNDSDLPESLPILALRNAVLFPGMVYPVTIGRDKSIALVKDAERDSSFIGAIPQNDISVEDPRDKDLFEYGTAAKIMKILEMPDGTVTAILHGIKRIRKGHVLSYEPYITANVTYVEDIVPENDDNTRMIAESLKEKAAAIIKAFSFAPREAVGAMKSIDNFQFLVNFIATTVEVENFSEKVELLRYDDVKVRAMKLLAALETQTQLLKIKQEINQKVKSDIDQQQREYYLNNQLKTIQEELGMNSDDEDIAELRDMAKGKKWPQYAAEAFEKELKKLEKLNPSSPDYNVEYGYITTLLELPWDETTEDNLDLANAQKVLDDDHFGSQRAKELAGDFICNIIMMTNEDDKRLDRVKDELSRHLPDDAPVHTPSLSRFHLKQKKGNKTNLVRVMNVLLEMGFFTDADGAKATKADFFQALGKLLNEDFKDYQNLLSTTKGASVADQRALTKIFEDMLDKQKELIAR